MLRFVSLMVSLFIVLVVAFALAQTAHAGGVVGDGSAISCTEAALDAALAGGGAVTFNCGGPKTILLTTAKNITQNTTIDGGNAITLTGNLATPLFHVGATTTSLALSNIILDRGYFNSSSGGAIWNAGTLTLSHVTIQGSGSTFCGGAIVTAGETTITNSTFDGNFATVGGGAICVRGLPGTKTSITDSFFTSNQAQDPSTGYGGALYVDYGTAIVRDSAFLFNTAHMGGAVYAAAGNATVTLAGSPASSIFASKLQLNANSATEDGGAIYNMGGSMTINNALLTVNKTPTQTALAGYGGGIHNEGVLTLTNSYLGQNEGRYGGGLFAGNASSGVRAWIVGTTFRRNVSGNFGGGLYANVVTTSVTISRSVFSGNSAFTGGGLARFNAALNIYDSSFTENTATVGGGMTMGAGPNASDGPYVRVQSVTVSGNTATLQGGGIYAYGQVELYSTTIVTNTGGVFSWNGNNTRFRGTVLQNPGYLNCDGDGTAAISDDGANFSTDNSCVLPNANSHTGIGLDPRLGPLTSDASGPTSYHMPLAGSPLINAGFNCPVRDQRGALRPDACDIGAVEFGGLLPPPLTYLYMPVVER